MQARDRMSKLSNRFFLYRNLRTKTWSQRSTKGRVVAHPTQVLLSEATFHVSQAVRERVVRTKRKEVHAGVRGKTEIGSGGSDWIEVSYNPYLYTSFVRLDTLEKVSSADKVFMDSNMKVWALNPR
jgi:hypothetical protein